MNTQNFVDQLVRGELNWENYHLCPGSYELLNSCRRNLLTHLLKSGLGSLWVQKVPGWAPVGRKCGCSDFVFWGYMTGWTVTLQPAATVQHCLAAALGFCASCPTQFHHWCAGVFHMACCALPAGTKRSWGWEWINLASVLVFLWARALLSFQLSRSSFGVPCVPLAARIRQGVKWFQPPIWLWYWFSHTHLLDLASTAWFAAEEERAGLLHTWRWFQQDIAVRLGMWHAVLPMCSCCVEVKKGQLICCEEPVSLGNGENAESEGRAAW